MFAVRKQRTVVPARRAPARLFGTRSFILSFVHSLTRYHPLLRSSNSPPTHNREKTETQKSPSEPKIFDFSCVCQIFLVPLHPNLQNRKLCHRRCGFEADGIPMPRIENFCGGVRVTIERTVFVKLSVSGQTGGQTGSQTTQKSVQKIVDFISENPNITTQEMANLLGINRSIVARHIKTLQEKGIIRRVGPDKGGHWEIFEK